MYTTNAFETGETAKDALLLQSPAGALLTQTLASGAPAHACLFAGPEGLGQERLARLVAAALLCERPAAGAGAALPACGACRSCTLFAAGNHPDFLWIEPDGATLKLEQIEQLRMQLTRRPFAGGRRAVVLRQADRLSLPAANSLLKTLEEPPPATHFILIAADPGRLPETIVSRCQRIPFRPWPRALVQAWLEATQAASPEDAALAARIARGLPVRAEQWLSESWLASLVPQVFAAVEALWRDDVVALLEQAQALAGHDRPTLLLALDLLGFALRDLWLVQQGAGAEDLTYADRHGWLASLVAERPRQGSRRVGFDLDAAVQQIARARARLEAHVQAQAVLDACLLDLAAIARGAYDEERVATP